MATDRFERSAGRVGVELVIAGNHPDFSPMLDSYLRGAKHMSGGMKGNIDLSNAAAFSVTGCIQNGFRAKPLAKHGGRERRAQVSFRAGARMVGMSMRDQGAGNRQPRVDVEAARFAPKAAVFDAQQWHFGFSIVATFTSLLHTSFANVLE
jgi:hypothetical protein